MVVEIAVLRAKPGATDQLRAALQSARSVIARAPGYIGSVFHQGLESPETFTLRIEWDTLEHHVQGFRQGPLFAEWRSCFSEFLQAPPVMEHHVVIAGP